MFLFLSLAVLNRGENTRKSCNNMKFPFLLFPSQTLWGLRSRKGDLIPPWVSGSVNSHLNNRGANTASILGHIPAQISRRGKGPAEESPCLVFCVAQEGASRVPSPLPSRQGGRVENCPVALEPRSPPGGGRALEQCRLGTAPRRALPPVSESQHARPLKGSRRT